MGRAFLQRCQLWCVGQWGLLWEPASHLTIWFIVLRIAYDSIKREALWSILQSYHLPAKLIPIIQAVHDGSRAAVRVYGRVSESFHVYLWSAPRQSQSYPLVPEEIRTHIKLHIFSFVIIPTLLYGPECAVLLQPHIHRLQSFIMRCLRIILGISGI